MLSLPLPPPPSPLLPSFLHEQAHHSVELSKTRPQLLGRNRAGSAFWLIGGDASHIFAERRGGQWECISRWTQIAPLTEALNACVHV